LEILKPATCICFHTLLALITSSCLCAVAALLPGGIGSVFHINTVALAAALDSGRVMLKHKDWLAKSDFCGPDKATLDSCYFEPLSNCTLSKDEIERAPEAITASNVTDLASQRVLRMDSMAIVVINEVRANVPKQFHDLLRKTGIPARSWHYWWRSQGVAYIVRPNARMIEEMARRKARCGYAAGVKVG
jgi:hypothetical protein